MFSNIGWTEMMVIAVIAVIFVGPKDLPAMLRQFGRFSRKIRSVAGDFQKQVDDALRESELDSVRDSINEVRDLDPRKAIKDRLNPLKEDVERDLNAEPAETTETAAPVFDEEAGPTPPEPVKVDVEAALARQAELDAADGAAAAPKTRAKKKPAAKKAATRKPAAKKASPKTSKAAAKPRAKAAGKAEA